VGAETYEFQADVSRVMDIIVHSLYSNRDVFLRELVSNGADACDKKRFRSLTAGTSGGLAESSTLRVRADRDGRTLSIEDNGIGMSKEELITNLGSIARSGTAKFVEALRGAGEDGAVSLIGQFGVGFYSAFLVADRVDVFSRCLADKTTWRWTSDGGGSSFQVSEAQSEELFGETSGTKVVLHLKDEASEYLDFGRLEELLRRYSEFVTLPIELWKQESSTTSGTFAWEVVNKVKPLWLRSPETVNESEYVDFYRSTFRALDEPLATVHVVAEGQAEFRALLFVPRTVPFELARDMFAEGGGGMRLYVQRVLVNDKFEELLPRWLTFVRGVVDSEDLPLNVGREILQKSHGLQIIRKRLVRKLLDTIDNLGRDAPDKFHKFWMSYGKYLKVGLIEDLDNRDELKRRVRFWSSKSGSNFTSLQEYVSRMKAGQDRIYFVTGEGRNAASIAPAMERMRLMDYEVLFFVDPLDEICGASIAKFEGTPLFDINKVGLTLNKTEEENRDLESARKEFESLTTWLKEELGDKVQNVLVSDRLVESPAMLVQGEWSLSPMMQRYMQSHTAASATVAAAPSIAGGATGRAVLEINPNSRVIKALKRATQIDPGAAAASGMATVLFETAALVGGYSIEDPAAFAKRIARLMEAASPYTDEDGDAGVEVAS